jgi:hypothetical protein
MQLMIPLLATYPLLQFFKQAEGGNKMATKHFALTNAMPMQVAAGAVSVFVLNFCQNSWVLVFGGISSVTPWTTQTVWVLVFYGIISYIQQSSKGICRQS